MANTAPTKGNLMAARRSRALAATGWELMDKKRNILTRELMDRMDRAAALQAEIDGVFNAAYGALDLAEAVSGKMTAFVSDMEEDESVRLIWRSIMGVEIPEIRSDAPDGEELPYALIGTSSAMDEAYRRFTRVKSLLAELAETENAVYRLAYAIEKSRKRANALQNIVLPGLDGDIDRIADALAEKEREEFVRRKVIKARKNDEAPRKYDEK